MKVLNGIRAIAALSLLVGAAPPLVAQTDTLRSAHALSDSARFGDAIALLRPYLLAHPTNGDAARLLSQLLYWMRDVQGARAIADSSLALHPEDTTLRLQYASMLIEIGDGERAGVVLSPLLVSPDRGRALGLLGTLAYWQGDLSTARRLFAEALRLQADQPEVRRQLGLILDATAPLVGAEVAIMHDDQTITSVNLSTEAAWYPTPLVRIGARTDPTYFALGDSATRELTTAEMTLTEYVPAARLDLDLAAGVVQRSFGSSTDWRGRAGLSLRLSSHVTAGVRGERAPYVSTLSSLGTAVMTNNATGLVHLDSPAGWLAEASIATQRFPDDNSVNSAFVWILAPLVHRSDGTLQVGYSLAWQDAEESRFVLAHPVQPVPVTSNRFDLSGRYAPYYTPQSMTSHSVLTAANIAVSSRATLRANASVGVRAIEDATTFHASAPSAVVGVVTRRSFTPWNVGAGIDITGRSAFVVSSGARFTHTAFYTAASGVLALSYRIGLGARRASVGL